ncbi:Transmembrane protein 151B [Anthophora retusa]
MNRENEEQRPVSQTLCGALQKEPNCKCLVLSVLIYGCLAAVTWCRCANVTKVVINFSRYPIKSTRHVSPCDDGYIYIPVAFMGMLYLVYLVECYHSPIRIDLLHAESQDSVLSKILQLKSAQPTIWWKAVSYHYVRRKRQITRYRNGDNYTTTQVYYERINTHAATSFYYYDYCGVKDISKELIMDPKVPITKINLSKGFAFSNMRSATEFEEARSRFFAEQELRDDYMEMREGLDLGYNPNPTTLVAVLGNPWFTNRYVYWCFSALLLSWPLRVIIEYKTQYADYQITKLFGINYDTPSGSEPIHASMSQQTINQPGSYMLAPSYSEALLMDPAPDQRPAESQATTITEMVPSYSEALLYQRAEQGCVISEEINQNENQRLASRECSCPCHATASIIDMNVLEENPRQEEEENGQSNEQVSQPLIETSVEVHPSTCTMINETENGKCGSCGKFLVEAQLENSEKSRSVSSMENPGTSSTNRIHSIRRGMTAANLIPRDISEPNLRSRTELIETDTRFLRLNGQSLRNILESDQEEEFNAENRVQELKQAKMNDSANGNKFRFSLCSLDEVSSRGTVDASRGAIPKRMNSRSRVIANPMSNESSTLPDSKTYFCLKSILKQNKRRYTLITARELQNLSDREDDEVERRLENRASYHEGCTPVCASTSNDGGRFNLFSRSKESLDGVLGKRKRQFLENISTEKYEDGTLKRENTKTLIFASPIQEVCPGDPFGGKDVVRTRQEVDSTPTEESPNHTVLTQLGRSLACDQMSSRRRFQESRRQRYSQSGTSHPSSFSCPPDRQHPYPYAFSASTNAVDSVDLNKNQSSTRVYQYATSFPPYEGSTSSHGEKYTDQASGVDRISPENIFRLSTKCELTRSLTEKRTRPVKQNANFRRSFTGRVEDYRMENNKWANLNMETSL